MSEQDQSVHQTRYSVLWKLLVDAGADQPLDLDEREAGLVQTESVPEHSHLEGEVGGLRHLQVLQLPPLQSAMKEMG